MSSPPFDVIVIGVGAVGSATVAELAARGLRVLGLERHGIPNEHGSSGGVNRMIRLAYSEDPRYVPLLRAAFERWHRLEARSGERLLVTTGGVDAGSPDSQSVTGSLESCRVHDLPHELLSAAELCRRFPGFSLPEGMVAVYQPDAGFVMSEHAIAAYAMQAIEDGAELHGHEPVIDWEPRGDGVVVRTSAGEYQADRLVISAGAWAAGLAEPLRHLVVPERQVLIWMQPKRPEHYRVGAFPVFVLEAPEGRFYGFPSYGIPGFKLGLYHHRSQQVDPDATDLATTDSVDEAVLRVGSRRYFPDADGPALTLKSCLFTNTPDEHFIIDRYPGLAQVVLASPCSGHGFKFASVLGEVLADMAMDRTPAFDMSWLGLDRFAVPVDGLSSGPRVAGTDV